MNYLDLFDIVLDFIDRDLIDLNYRQDSGTRGAIFSPIYGPDYYDCRFLPDKFKTKFKLRLDGFFDELIDKYLGSPTNARCINGIVDMIYGRGLEATDSEIKPEMYAKMKMLLKQKDLRRVVNDYKMLGQSAVQVVYNKRKTAIVKVLHFPMETLRAEKAKKGQSIFTSDVFFGNEESNNIKTVSTFISNKRQAKIHNNRDLSKVMVWPIKIAFYSKAENKTSPDYEISLELDEVGVVYSYKVDYGDFEVIAKLKDFKVIEKQVCNN